MAVSIRSRRAAVLAAAAALTLAVAGCSASSSSSGGTTPSASGSGSSPFGPANPATGTPLLFGSLNLESGPVTFPEISSAEQAAVSYVNQYLGGIGGHPIKLVTCATDGSPSTSQRCANQILDQKPIAIVGAGDTGAPGAIPVWQRADLAYIGGVGFTPVELNYPNAVIFSGVSGPDNAAAAGYTVTAKGAKSAAVIYTSDTQGTYGGKGVVAAYEKAGIASSSITQIPIPPTSSDVSSAVATAIGAKPDVIFVNAPAACPAILSSLKQLGYAGVLAGIGPCTSPPAITGANGGADGLLLGSPTIALSSNTPETNLFLAALNQYAPKTTPDQLAQIGFQTIINLQAKLAKFTTAQLTTASILAAFREGTDNANFMGHPYTCDGKQMPGSIATCNAFQQIQQVKGTDVIVASPDWVNPAPYMGGTAS